MKNTILKSALINKFFSGKVFGYFRLWLELGVGVGVGKIYENVQGFNYGIVLTVCK